MAVGDVLKVVHYMSSEGQAGLNVRYYRISAQTSGPVSLGVAAVALDAIFAPLYQELLSSSALYRAVGVQKVFPLPIGNESFSGGFDRVGLRTGDPLPKQIAGVLSFRTALAGRRNRGRLYCPFPAEVSNTSSSEPNSTYIEDLGTLGTAHLATRVITDGPNSETFVPVIFRRGAGTTQDLTARIIRVIWGTQRRRGDFGRPNVIPV